MKTIMLSSLLIIAVLAQGGFALKCYDCSGETCMDPYTPNEGHTGCDYRLSPPRNASCTKIESGSSVTRNCATNCKPGCIAGVCTYCCYTEFCNGGVHPVVSWVAIGVALVANIIFFTR